MSHTNLSLQAIQLQVFYYSNTDHTKMNRIISFPNKVHICANLVEENQMAAFVARGKF